MLTEDELAMMLAIRGSGSLSKAAAHLGKAPSTISHAARQLESRYDALLFDRRRYRLELTPAGKLLAEEAERLLTDMARLNTRVRQIASGWEDRLTIVTDELLEFQTLLPVISDFDKLKSGVGLRITHEVLGGTWSALKEGRADLVIGATNEPPAIPRLRWFELGTLDWVFAVAMRHPLASVAEPLQRETIQQYRAAVVADTAQGLSARTYGVQGGQEQLAVPTMAAKIAVQRAGLAVGWLPRNRVSQLLSSGELVEKQLADQREPNTIYVAWRGEHTGKALTWWVERLREPHLMKRLVDGLEVR